MAMTQLALERRAQVEQWVLGNIHSASYRALHKHGGNTEGYLGHRRLMMMAGQVQIPDNNGVHILDDDANWRIFRREMKIPFGKFHRHSELSAVYVLQGELTDGWLAILFEHELSIERFFYRTRVHRSEAGTINYRPQLVTEFPDFGRFPEEKVYQALGLSGGSEELSSDTSLKSLTLWIDSNSFAVTIVPDQEGYTQLWSASATIRIVAEATNEFAVVKNGEPVQYDGNTPVTIRFSVTSEDDETVDHRFTVRGS